MIQAIIILALLQIGFNLLFKPKYNQLNCGLFGAAADDVSKININKLKILGIFNDSRGGHSCGMTIDGDIIYGTNKSKLFKDFISNNNIVEPDTLPVVLGHTRFATGGAHIEENAHPFGYGSNGDFYNFIGTHNGSLHNEGELAEIHGISTKATTLNNITRNKIDSEILLEIVYKKGFKVLEEYEGGAALAMYNTKKPKTIYLYHGASKKTFSAKEEVEERPLFYYQESPGVFYYSSLEESLEAINDTNGMIEAFDHNIVYEIRDGNVDAAKKHIIDRSKCCQTKVYVQPETNYSFYNNKEYDYKTESWFEKKQTSHYLPEAKSISTTNSKVKETLNTNNLYDHRVLFEKENEEYIKDNVYYENLRFYKNKTLLSGIYILNKDLKLHRICGFVESFDSIYNELSKDDFVKKLKKFYFVDGIMLLDEIDYIQISGNISKHSIPQISHCSVYPIKNIYIDNSHCYFRGNLASLNFSSFFSKDIIRLTNGICKAINKKDISFEQNKKYYLPEDLELINSLITSDKEEVILETNDDKVMQDLYKENLLATVEYCSEDVGDSIDDIVTQNKIKTALDRIKDFISSNLNLL